MGTIVHSVIITYITNRSTSQKHLTSTMSKYPRRGLTTTKLNFTTTMQPLQLLLSLSAILFFTLFSINKAIDLYLRIFYKPNLDLEDIDEMIDSIRDVLPPNASISKVNLTEDIENNKNTSYDKLYPSHFFDRINTIKAMGFSNNIPDKILTGPSDEIITYSEIENAPDTQWSILINSIID